MSSPVRSFIDGIPFKIADKYVRPTIVSAPNLQSSETFNRMIASLQYPFTTERQVLEWTELERQAMAEQAAAEEQDRDEQNTSSDDDDSHQNNANPQTESDVNAGDASPGGRTLISRQHSIFARLGKDILTPTPITPNANPTSESSEPATQINPVDFEAERDIFESVTLQTIDVEAELADVFSQASVVTSTAVDATTVPDPQASVSTDESLMTASQNSYETVSSAVSQTSVEVPPNSTVSAESSVVSQPNVSTNPFISDQSISSNPFDATQTLNATSHPVPSDVTAASNYNHTSTVLPNKAEKPKPAVSQKPVLKNVTMPKDQNASCSSNEPPTHSSQAGRSDKPAGAIATPFAFAAGAQMTNILQARAKANSSNNAAVPDYENVNKHFLPPVQNKSTKKTNQRFSNPVYDEIILAKPQPQSSSSKSSERPLPPIPPRPGERPKSGPIKVKGRSISDVGDLFGSDQETVSSEDVRPTTETNSVHVNNSTVSWRKRAPPMPAPPPAGSSTTPAVPVRSRLPDPFDSLDSDGKDVVRGMKGMGFPGPRAARVVQRIGSDEQKVLDHLLRIGHLMEKSEHSSDQIELAITAYPDLDNEKVDDFIEQCLQLQQLGFEYMAVQKAMFEANQDRDKALDLLTSI